MTITTDTLFRRPGRLFIDGEWVSPAGGSVIPAADEASAIRTANDTIYGLNASVFTADPERALQVAAQLRSGTVGHNAVRSDLTLGFGGFKQSGVGREGGVEGLRQFLESKAVILDEVPRSHAPRTA
jgi:aldehyde dehydrogenase (NAD+)